MLYPTLRFFLLVLPLNDVTICLEKRICDDVLNVYKLLISDNSRNSPLGKEARTLLVIPTKDLINDLTVPAPHIIIRFFKFQITNL